MYESLNNYDFKTILVVNTGDQKSRDFLASLSPEEWGKVTQVLDYYKNQEELQRYIDDVGYPRTFSDFPAAWVVIPKSHTYTDKDQIAVLQGFTSFRQIVDESQWQMIECIIEEFQQTLAYKRQYIKTQILMSEAIPATTKAQLMACETTEHIHILFQCLLQEGVIKEDVALVETVRKHVDVDLGQTINLVPARKAVPLPYERAEKIEQCLNRVEL